MSVVIELRVRAERCRSSTFTVPVVATLDEARELAQRIADQLAGLSGREALLCLASLHDVQAALAGRVAHLQDEMASTRRELRQVSDAGRACRSYGQIASPSRPRSS